MKRLLGYGVQWRDGDYWRQGAAGAAAWTPDMKLGTCFPTEDAAVAAFGRNDLEHNGKTKPRAKVVQLEEEVDFFASRSFNVGLTSKPDVSKPAAPVVVRWKSPFNSKAYMVKKSELRAGRVTGSQHFDHDTTEDISQATVFASEVEARRHLEAPGMWPGRSTSLFDIVPAPAKPASMGLSWGQGKCVAIDRRTMQPTELPPGVHTIKVGSPAPFDEARFFIPQRTRQEMISLYGLGMGTAMADLLEKHHQSLDRAVMHMFPTAPKDVSGWLAPTPESRITGRGPAWMYEPIKVDERLLERPTVREPVSGFAVVLCRPDGTVFGEKPYLMPDGNWSFMPVTFKNKDEALRMLRARSLPGTGQECIQWRPGIYGRRLAYVTRDVLLFEWNEWIIRKKHVVKFPTEREAKASMFWDRKGEFKAVKEDGDWVVRAITPERFSSFPDAIARCNELKGGRDMWDAVSVRTTSAPVF